MSQVFRIEPSLFALIPDAVIGVIICEGVDNRGENAGVLQSLSDEVARLPGRIEGDVSTHPAIAPWRDAYRTFGAKASKYPSSIENLIRRILKGYVPGHINTLVDIYNAISLKYLLPVGGEDLDAATGDVLLTIAGDAEAPIHLLGEADARAPELGEVIYKDDNGAICRRWNWKEAERTKLTEDTTRAILVIEAVPPISREQLETALAELESRVRDATGARTVSVVLDRVNVSVELRVP